MINILRLKLLFLMTSVICVSLEGSEVVVDCERPHIMRGEPLVVTIVVTNTSQFPIVVNPQFNESSKSIFTSAGQLLTVPVPNSHAGAEMTFTSEVLPGTSERFLIAVTETAFIKQTGKYRIDTRSIQPQLTGSLSFEIVESDKTSLAVRANEFLQRAEQVRGEEKAQWLAALAGVEGISIDNLLCRALNADQDWSQTLIEKLARTGTPQAVACLLQGLPNYPNDERLLAIGRLQRIASTTSNAVTRKQIQDALPGK